MKISVNKRLETGVATNLAFCRHVFRTYRNMHPVIICTLSEYSGFSLGTQLGMQIGKVLD